MITYLVGGAVRDKLLELPESDRDFCVVGTTVQAMLEAGYKQVGKDFPVFLHPTTGEEYALARTERKSGPGYTGFEVFADSSVTLEQDLARRDLTINAMALDHQENLIDPFGGLRDLQNKVLRHVRADSFIEDPVRVLRLARFYARYSDFTIAHETVSLVQSMVQSGELDHLVHERVWQELTKGLSEASPHRMFEFLHSCGALEVLIPELDHQMNSGNTNMMVLKFLASDRASLEERFAGLMYNVDGVHLVCQRLRSTSSCQDLAMIVYRRHWQVRAYPELNELAIVTLFEETDAFRRPARFGQLLRVSETIMRVDSVLDGHVYTKCLELAHKAVRALDLGIIAQECEEPCMIPTRIREARVKCLGETL